MAKIDWGKAGHRELDPARFQKVDDFITPDDETRKKKKRRSAPLTQAMAAAQQEAKAFRQHLTKEAARIRSETEAALPRKGRAARKRAPIPKPSAATRKAEITQAEVLSALGFSKSARRTANWGEILKGLVADGLLLNTGQPNVKHPQVITIINDKAKAADQS